MADVPEEICAFCQEGEDAGSLRNTSDNDILAHYRCLLFSPGVITRPMQDSQDYAVEFDILSVLSEIKRGRNLKCTFCGKRGATVGCDERRCRKTYHYPCVLKDQGERVIDEDKEIYIAYCLKHSRKNQGAEDGQPENDAETSGTSTTSACSHKSHGNTTSKRRRKRLKHNRVRKKLRFDEPIDPGIVPNVEMHNGSKDEQRPSHQLLDNHTNEEDMEVPGPSRTHQEHVGFYILSDSGSNEELSESNGPHSAQIKNDPNAKMRTESERKERPSDHTNSKDKEPPEPCMSVVRQDQPAIIESDPENYDFSPFNGSQLVYIKGEGNSTRNDTSVTSTPSGILNETMRSPPCERISSSSTDSSGSRTPEILHSFSLSGFPKRNKKRKRKRSNPELIAAFSTMASEERDAYSQLYDEVGGSLTICEDLIAYDDCDHVQTEDVSNVTVQDIPKDQQSGTNERSDGCNLAASESSRLIQTPEGQSASFTHVHDAGSISQLPRPTPGVTSSTSGQPIDVTNKVKNTNNLKGIIVHPAGAANGSERSSSTSGDMLTSAQPEDSADGENNARAQDKEIFNGKDKLDESVSAVYHNLSKLLDDQHLSSDSTNKSSDKEQLMRSPNMNISSEQFYKDTKDKDSLLEFLKTIKKSVDQYSYFSKNLNSANTVTLSDKEPPSSPSVAKTSEEKHFKSQSTKNSSEQQYQNSSGIRMLDEEPTRTVTTTRELVHNVNSPNSHLPKVQTENVLRAPSQSEAHLSATTTGTDSLIGQPSYSPLVMNKCTEMAASSPRAKEETLVKEASTSREEARPTSSGITGHQASENKSCHLSQQSIKAFSDRLKQGTFSIKFNSKSIQQTLNTRKSSMTQPSRDGDVTSEQYPEHSIVAQQTCNSNVDENLRNSGQAEDEPASPDDLLGDDPLNVEVEIIELDEEAAPLSRQAEDEPASPDDLLRDDPMQEEVEIIELDEEAALLSDSPGDIVEDEPVHVEEEMTPTDKDTGDFSTSPAELLEHEPVHVEEEITPTDEDTGDISDSTNDAVLTAKTSQTEISFGFPQNVDKPMNLNSDQKSHLMERYKETENQMSRTGDMEAGAAQAFWDLCRENRCQEFLLTLITCHIKSVIHKIVYGQPEGTDFEQAFTFLQASGCFADFIHRTEDDQGKMNSRTGDNEPCNGQNPNYVDCCKEVADQGEFTRDEDPGDMEPETTSTSNKMGECTREGGLNEAETELSKTSSLAASSKAKEISRDKENDVVQHVLCESPSEHSRKDDFSRDEEHSEIQHDLSKLSSESNRKEESSREEHDGMEHELSESPSESSRKEESSREKHDGMQHELSESPSESSRKEESSREKHDGMQHELSESPSESSRKEESSREKHDGMQHELSESSSESSRKEESSREEHDGMQHELSESSSGRSRIKESSRDEVLDIMEIESPEASLVSPSASTNSDVALSENTCLGHMTSAEFQSKTTKKLQVLETQLQSLLCQLQQQTEDGDVGFATNLVQFLRKVPEDKKLSTQISILNVLSVSGQQSTSISNPMCASQRHTNPSSPELGEQTQPPKP